MLTFGDKPLEQITTDDIEAFRDARKAAGLSAVAVNHDLKLLRTMFNWAVRKGYVTRTPFKIGSVPALPSSARFRDTSDSRVRETKRSCWPWPTQISAR